jgi:hypothetical protein
MELLGYGIDRCDTEWNQKIIKGTGDRLRCLAVHILTGVPRWMTIPTR